MKIKKEKKGDYTKFTAEVDCLTFEAEIDDGGYGQSKILNGGYEMDALHTASLYNIMKYGEELEEQYKLFTKFIRKIKKNHKINKNYIPKLTISQLTEFANCK